jgi:hypothetical protein
MSPQQEKVQNSYCGIAGRSQKRDGKLCKGADGLFENAQEAIREWLDRAQAEATVASEFASRLTGAL